MCMRDIAMATVASGNKMVTLLMYVGCCISSNVVTMTTVANGSNDIQLSRGLCCFHVCCLSSLQN